MNYSETELVYGQVNDHQLSAIFYRPETADSSSAFVIDVHGGAWSSGHRKSGQHYDRLLAQNGVCVLAIDFRQAPDFQHPSASADVCAAVRFVRQTDLLGFNPARLGLVGSSSGGHLALLAGLKPDIEEHKGTQIRTNAGFIDVDDQSAEVEFVIALWPVSNPLARYQYATMRAGEDASTWGPNFTPDRLTNAHRAYYPSQQAMQDATVQRILADKEYQHLPRIFVVQPELDLNVPVFMSQTLAGALKNENANYQYKMYPGVAHGFAHFEGEQTSVCISDMLGFMSDEY